MINDTTAGRWLRRVIWLGIFANLALALPTIAAPRHDDRHDGISDRDAGALARASPACCW
jgi:hypothetical protein